MFNYFPACGTVIKEAQYHPVTRGAGPEAISLEEDHGQSSKRRVDPNEAIRGVRGNILAIIRCHQRTGRLEIHASLAYFRISMPTT